MIRLACFAIPAFALAACATHQTRSSEVFAVVSVHPPRMDLEHIPTFSQGPAQQKLAAGEHFTFVLSPAVAAVCDGARTACRHGIVTVRTTVEVDSLSASHVRGHVTIDREVGQKTELRSETGSSQMVFAQTVSDGVPTLDEQRDADRMPFYLSFGETVRFPSFHGGEVELSFLPEATL